MGESALRTSGRDLAGEKVGRWLVLDEFQINPRGEKLRLCQCECGTQRYVRDRSLRYGGSLSCGCLQREASSKSAAHDLTGQRFGELLVLGMAPPRKNGGIWWRCECSCGKEYEVPGTLLVTGRRTHCGCLTRRGRPNDIAGQRFNRLTALYPTQERDAKGSVIWHCRCDCGNEVDVPYNYLLYCDIKSCGCQKKEHDQKLSAFLTHVSNTSLDMVKSRKVPKDNTTGVRGVYLIKGRYEAKIVFQKKQYYLGKYDTVAEAAKARQAAEEILFGGTIAYYEQWEKRAAEDPQWAEENPVEISVSRENGELKISFAPELKIIEQQKT